MPIMQNVALGSCKLRMRQAFHARPGMGQMCTHVQDLFAWDLAYAREMHCSLPSLPTRQIRELQPILVARTEGEVLLQTLGNYAAQRYPFMCAVVPD
jgi:hypothetical protein